MVWDCFIVEMWLATTNTYIHITVWTGLCFIAHHFCVHFNLVQESVCVLDRHHNDWTSLLSAQTHCDNAISNTILQMCSGNAFLCCTASLWKLCRSWCIFAYIFSGGMLNTLKVSTHFFNRHHWSSSEPSPASCKVLSTPSQFTARSIPWLLPY